MLLTSKIHSPDSSLVDNGKATLDPTTAKATTKPYQNVVLADMMSKITLICLGFVCLHAVETKTTSLRTLAMTVAVYKSR